MVCEEKREKRRGQHCGVQGLECTARVLRSINQVKFINRNGMERLIDGSSGKLNGNEDIMMVEIVGFGSIQVTFLGVNCLTDE